MSLFTEIKNHESAVTTIYIDSKGIPTIGVGFNLREEKVLEAVFKVSIDAKVGIRRIIKILLSIIIYHLYKGDN
ncbi:lysozyme [Pseudoalteromonas rubra]|uniref:Uncharacterized protein n=1 Tax=Pseudoalteromonas rubra TaxID=43658 RepID=A0A5S3WMC6_9GAMM|nr:lysozyme [Pseudoalteromonas rubra]TMP29003.1 hypothetical protein CWB98_23640 [Pseudoalteromonas rubra]